MRYNINKISDNIGKAIRVERVKRGLTQYELADLCNIGHGTLSKVEHFKRLAKADTMLMICNGLNMSFDELIRKAEELARWEEY